MFTLPKKESFYSKYILFHFKTGLFSSVSQRRWWVDYLCIDTCRFRHQSRITLLVSVLSLVSCWSLPFQTHPHLGKKTCCCSFNLELIIYLLQFVICNVYQSDVVLGSSVLYFFFRGFHFLFFSRLHTSLWVWDIYPQAEERTPWDTSLNVLLELFPLKADVGKW